MAIWSRKLFLYAAILSYDPLHCSRLGEIIYKMRIWKHFTWASDELFNEGRSDAPINVMTWQKRKFLSSVKLWITGNIFFLHESCLIVYVIPREIWGKGRHDNSSFFFFEMAFLYNSHANTQTPLPKHKHIYKIEQIGHCWINVELLYNKTEAYSLCAKDKARSY